MIQNDEYRMLTIACGSTLLDNFKNKCYYDPIDRGYSHCTHLGIYNQKRVKGVGKVSAVHGNPSYICHPMKASSTEPNLTSVIH